MKYLKTLTGILILLATFFIQPVYAVDVKVSGGVSDSYLQSKIETSLQQLLTEINAAYNDERKIDFNGLNITEHVEVSLSMLWDNSPFICLDDLVCQRVNRKMNGEYEIRNIPLQINSTDENPIPEDEEYQEAVVSFDASGRITSFYLTIGMNLYMSVLRNSKDVTDQRYRELILDFTERFRTAYNEHNSEFLKQIFSDDALIITGKVVQRKHTDDGMQLPPDIITTTKNKEQYLRDLKRVFAKDYHHLIHVTFDDIKVMRHPNTNSPYYSKVYGVTLHQTYRSGGYSDEGFLFLLWDFSNENKPQIHVRTWQPDEFGVVPYSISDFDDFRVIEN